MWTAFGKALGGDSCPEESNQGNEDFTYSTRNWILPKTSELGRGPWDEMRPQLWVTSSFQPSETLSRGPSWPTLTPDAQKLLDNTFVLFSAAKFIVIYYSCNRKLMHYLLFWPIFFCHKSTLTAKKTKCVNKSEMDEENKWLLRKQR